MDMFTENSIICINKLIEFKRCNKFIKQNITFINYIIKIK